MCSGRVTTGNVSCSGERVGQACPNLSPALCVSSMSGPSKDRHTPALLSELLRDTGRDVYEWALFVPAVSTSPQVT